MLIEPPEIEPGASVAMICRLRARGGKDGADHRRRHGAHLSALWLVERGITLFATDLDDPAEWWWPTHATWLKSNVCMVQQLCNLDRLVGKSFLFVCLPMKMRDGAGCSVRAAALVM